MTTTDPGVAQAITEQFINENPSNIVIRRRDQIATSAGGKKFGPETNLSSQVLRLISGRIYAETIRTTSDGRQVHPTFSLVGPLDADIEKFDLFNLEDSEYEVVWVTRKALFQRTVAEVWQYGQGS